MSKVLVLTNSLGGLYSFRRELMQKLIEESYEVFIVAPKYEEKELLFATMGCKCIRVAISRRGTNPIVDLKLLMRYLKIIKEIKPDVVLTYTIKPNIYGGLVCRFLGVPYIANITGLGSAVENKGILQTLNIFLYRIAFKKAHCVFFQNQENMLFFEHNVIALNKPILIPGSGVNLEHFHLMEYPSDNIVNFLFIGRVMKEKGIEQYLEAAEYIKKKYSNTVFHILGSCEEAYARKLKEMQDMGIVIYHGRQDDVREFHKISHCTIHPTYYPEGMSNVLLESAACGRPVITTNRAGCREIVDDGVNGYFVQQQNSKDLIEKIEKFLELDYKTKKKMGLNGRNKVEKEFDRQIVVNTYLDEMKSIYNGVE